MRAGLRALIEEQPDIRVVADAQDGREAVRRMARFCADIAIVDITMPELNGFETTREILKSCPASRVIILSMYSTYEHIFLGLEAGAKGYLLKESAGSEVVDAVRAVYAGGMYLSSKIPAHVLLDYIGRHKAARVKSPLASLSQREREILQLVVEGRSSAQIADTLQLSAKTVDTYRSRLMAKLEITNVPSLVKFAIQHGLTPLK